MIKKRNNMINNTKKKQGYIFIFILLVSLVMSAFIFYLFGQGKLININYDKIKQLSNLSIFFKILKRNFIYILLIIIFTYLGNKIMIYFCYIIVNIYFGMSIIYLVKVIEIDKLYLLCNLPDYIIFFPLTILFTYISVFMCRRIRKLKKVKTKMKKLDIIRLDFIKVALIYFIIVVLFSFLYSIYLSLVL